MANNLYNQLSSSALNGKNIFLQWRQQWVESKNDGVLSILQLCIDMTGFAYKLKEDDLKLMEENMQMLLKKKILIAPFKLRNFPRDDTLITNLQSFLENLIVRPWKELLTDNGWLNKTVKLILYFCTSERDECVMVGSFFGIIMLHQLCAGRHNLQYDLEQAALREDSQVLSMLEKKHRYIDCICMALFSNVREGFKYAAISSLLTERVCVMLLSFPYLLVIVYKQLGLMTEIISLKHKQNVHAVLKCFKSLTIDAIDVTVKREVSLCIMEAAKALFRIMDKFNPFESLVLELFIHACRITGDNIDNEIAERVAIRIFRKDDNTVNAAIQLLSLYFTNNNERDGLETDILLAIIHTFKQYEYPLTSLDAIVKKLWQEGFIQKFNNLFQILVEVYIRETNLFGAKCVVHVINCCHQLLMNDIRRKISPSQHGSDTVSWSNTKTRVESFVNGYPKCLATMFQHPDLFNLLLDCLSPDDRELYTVAGVNCEHYYVDALYNTLSTVALNAEEYPMLCRTLSAIYRFDTIIHISEDIWNELTEKYYTSFFHTRSRLRTFNLGTDAKLMNAYTTAITRLCALMEINNTSENVFALANYLANDLRLLGRMRLSDEANAIFYRLYKNALYAREHYILQDADVLQRRSKTDQAGKQVQLLMGELVAQLDAEDTQPNEVGRHIVVALCDMLVLTQPDASNNASVTLQQMVHPVENDVFEKLAKYVERNVFGKGSDEDTVLLSVRKLMLVTYSKLYRLHNTLPRLSDTRHILKHYGESTAFSEELEQLLYILYSISANDFYDIVTHVFLDCCQTKRYFNRVKMFLKHIQMFHSKTLENIVEVDSYCVNIVQRLLDKILEHHFADDTGKQLLRNLCSIIKPLVEQISRETRKELENIISNHPKYTPSREMRSLNKHFQQLLKNTDESF